MRDGTERTMAHVWHCLCKGNSHWARDAQRLSTEALVQVATANTILTLLNVLDLRHWSMSRRPYFNKSSIPPQVNTVVMVAAITAPFTSTMISSYSMAYPNDSLLPQRKGTVLTNLVTLNQRSYKFLFLSISTSATSCAGTPQLNSVCFL
ncbi:uncharacterized protein F5147DRAFT_713518 [Suillus discolor]|uniref:Uncharacterized protein n=1 Tax=Suillus discolor TaxID=1912936 RepID=A0A9P7F049_9AGAM|nr:uncharacterized protein F5147DRAFT_713518 [Suillus discolor]KAG2098728.1 hypothetical protein F5147DRAFT_713518 [Suillus discolor]